MPIPPLSGAELMAMITTAEAQLTYKELRLWELIKIPPTRWSGGDYG